MSERTESGIARYLSLNTRRAIEAVVTVDWTDFASNIESKLRSRGEHDLAERMLQEIRLSTGRE